MSDEDTEEVICQNISGKTSPHEDIMIVERNIQQTIGVEDSGLMYAQQDRDSQIHQSKNLPLSFTYSG